VLDSHKALTTFFRWGPKLGAAIKQYEGRHRLDVEYPHMLINRRVRQGALGPAWMRQS